MVKNEKVEAAALIVDVLEEFLENKGVSIWNFGEETDDDCCFIYSTELGELEESIVQILDRYDEPDSDEDGETYSMWFDSELGEFN